MDPNQVYQLGDLQAPVPLERASNAWSRNDPIIVDFGSYQTRVGVASQSSPSHVFASQAVKYKDRKSGVTVTAVGNDMFADPSAMQNAKPTHDSGIVTSWDSVEQVFDYSFDKLGVSSHGMVDSPIVVSELLAGPHAPRKTMAELLFEGYGVPKAAFGVDSLFAFYNECGNKASGIVVSGGHDFTTVIPVINGQPDLSNAKRINWGGRNASEYMQNLLAMKYPMFPTRVSPSQAAYLLREHCYVSGDYNTELANFLNFDGLDKRERIIQAPIVGDKKEKSEEELARIAERRKESGRRLQEQALRARQEKIALQENDLAILQDVDTSDIDAVRAQGFRSAADLEAAIVQLEIAIRRAQHRDGSAEPEEGPVPEFPLVDIPDEKLDPETLKEKRRQRLMKANYDARMKVKQEKLEEKKRLEEAERLEREWRERDLNDWIKHKRADLERLQASVRERQRIRSDLSNRKSLASKMRMKSIALLASEGRNAKRKRTKNDAEDDTFGADDDDWQVYAQNESEEDEEVELERINELQQLLLEYDPSFTVEDLEGPKADWRKNTVHLFLYGAHPLETESVEQLHQLNLNIERIRVPEVLLQPSLAGVDQAGISEIVGDMLVKWYPQQGLEMAKNIILTGGLANIRGLEDRVRNDVVSVMPVGSEISVRTSSKPSLDAWKGMAKWSRSDDSKGSFISKREYEEKGSDYLKIHSMGNTY